MTTVFVLFIYIIGIWISYFQIQKWSDEEVKSREDFQTVLLLSLLSWGIYPLYGIVWLIKKIKED